MKRNLPYNVNHVPLHRLNTPQTKLWLMSGAPRRMMADQLAKRYPSGVGVLSRSCHLIAYVQPNGAVRELPPPHQRYMMYHIVNQPELKDCQCQNFFDPETGVAWRERGSDLHHPMCQFEPVSMPVWVEATKAGHARQQEGKRAQARPDDWERLRQNYRGR